jgi:hypothetical protein
LRLKNGMAFIAGGIVSDQNAEEKGEALTA